MWNLGRDKPKRRFSCPQGTPAGLVRYRVERGAYSYSASIFEVEEHTGNVVTRVNLNEEPNLRFNVSPAAFDVGRSESNSKYVRSRPRF